MWKKLATKAWDNRFFWAWAILTSTGAHMISKHEDHMEIVKARGHVWQDADALVKSGEETSKDNGA